MSDDANNGVPEDNGIDPEQENANGLRGFAALGQFLQEDGWFPQTIEEANVYRMYFAGQNGEMACFAQVRVDLEQLLFYVVMPVRVAEEMRPAVAEFITRANYGLRIGNFEMDYEDGEVRYKSSLDFEGEMLTDNLIRGVVYPAAQTMDRYLPGLMSVVYGNKEPATAIADIEEQF